MIRKVTIRGCKKVMAKLFQHQDIYHDISNESEPQFIKEMQSDSKARITLEYLEAKGYVALGKNPITQNLYQIQITKAGLTFFEDQHEAMSKKRMEWVRYIVTTLIALAALIKSFMPEILALWESLWPKA